MHAAHGTLPGGRLAAAPEAELALRYHGQLLDATEGFGPGGAVLPAGASGGSGDYLGAIARQVAAAPPDPDPPPLIGPLI
eukprot:1077573-Prymnesium_polylepis.1